MRTTGTGGYFDTQPSRCRTGSTPAAALAEWSGTLAERSAALPESTGGAGKGVYGPENGNWALRSRIRTAGRPVFAPSNPPVATA
jgi:hypothetical protein